MKVKRYPKEAKETVIAVLSYDGESLVDLDRDISEIFDDVDIEQDSDGFFKGEFIITVSHKYYEKD